MKISALHIKGTVAKKDDRYVVRDNLFLKELVVSSTRLKARCKTNGHAHKKQEEIYFFLSGRGKIKIDDDIYFVCKNSIVLIPDGAFHQVENTEDVEDLYFVCIFNGKRYDKKN
jgi:mannose-6-phosphate isomerase-like protein (cupin superfamily)